MKKILFLLLMAPMALAAQPERAATTKGFVLNQQQWEELAATPPMGWNSWNLVEDKVSEEVIRQMCDAMVANGMRDAGYTYLIIDDFWVGGRDNRNRLYPDPTRFPGGIKALADYVHSKGMKLGIYSDAALYTCGGVMASYGFEELDAKTFAEWGVDYLKYDYCNAPTDMETAFARYKKMGDALRKQEHPIVYAICEWGQRKPWLWAKAAGGHLWRTTWDSRDYWQTDNKDFLGVIDIFDQQEGLEQYAGPGGWNDPDLLMVGLYGKGKSSSPGKFKGGCTDTEYRTHFAMWCMLAAPLIVNSDMTTIDAGTLALLTNKHLLAINQDKDGHQGYTFMRTDQLQLMKKELSGGEVAVCVINRSDNKVPFSFDARKDWGIYTPGQVIDVWKSTSSKKTALKGELEPHDCAVYLFKVQ